MNQAITFCLTLSLVLGLGCNSVPEKSQREHDENQVIELAFSHFLANSQGNFYLCRLISDSSADVDSALLARLKSKYAKPNVGVHNLSEATLKDVRTNPQQIRDDHYVDRITGAAGESLTVSQIKWIDGNTIELRISRWFGLLAGSSDKYTFARTKILFFFNRGWRLEGSQNDIKF